MESSETPKNPIGQLFGTINYTSQSDIDKFVENMNPEQAFYILNLSLKYSQSKGLFSLEESEVISKSLRVFTKNTETNE